MRLPAQTTRADLLPRHRLMHLLLKKVTLYEDRLDLDIRTEGMQQLLGELDYEDHN